MPEFTEWLLDELQRRGWQPADLAKQAELSTGSISNILTGKRKPGANICVSIADALNISPERVFRIAGLLPVDSEGEDDPATSEIYDLARRLSSRRREEALNYIRYLHQIDQVEK